MVEIDRLISDMRFFLNKKFNKGFTLIELLVAISVFVILFIVILAIFTEGIRQQRIAFATQILLDQTSYALELMSRTLRMAGNKEGCPLELTDNGKGIQFTNSIDNGLCQAFFVKDNKLKYNINKGGDNQIFDLTSDKIKINSFNFSIQKKGGNYNLAQPRITMFFDVQTNQDPLVRIKVQTTVSQRNLNVP